MQGGELGPETEIGGGKEATLFFGSAQSSRCWSECFTVEGPHEKKKRKRNWGQEESVAGGRLINHLCVWPENGAHRSSSVGPSFEL